MEPQDSEMESSETGNDDFMGFHGDSWWFKQQRWCFNGPEWDLIVINDDVTDQDGGFMESDHKDWGLNWIQAYI